MKNIIEKSSIYCIAAHSAVGQKRKYTGEDYWVHPIEVGNIFQSLYGCKEDPLYEEMVAACHLHDVIEDTQTSIHTIEFIFGKPVAELVSGLTDLPRVKGENRGARTARNRAHTVEQDWRVHAIKCCDLISNTRSIVEHDKDFAAVYLQEKELLLIDLINPPNYNRRVTPNWNNIWRETWSTLHKAKKQLEVYRLEQSLLKLENK